MSQPTGHAADGEPRAVVDTRLTHQVHRRATSLMAAAPGDPSVPDRVLAELRDFLVAALQHHHHSEDDVLWPMILTASPQLAGELSDLSGDHERLADALHELAAVPIGDATDRAALSRAAAAVRDLVHTHLASEEELLLPALRDHITEEGWDRFARHVVATSPPEISSLMVGFLDQVGTPEEVALVLLALPEEAEQHLPVLREQARAVLDALQPTR